MALGLAGFYDSPPLVWLFVMTGIGAPCAPIACRAHQGTKKAALLGGSSADLGLSAWIYEEPPVGLSWGLAVAK